MKYMVPKEKGKPFKNLKFMLKRKTKLILLLLIGLYRPVVSQEIWTIGPMIHVNFGGEKTRISYAVECSYWNFRHFFYGVDGGIEWGPERFRVYSEMQTGFGLAGLALGPLLELNTTEGTAHFGMQSSVWANYFLGFDYRRRWVNKDKYNCLGVYFKVPFTDSGFSDSNSSTSNYYHHHHHHHHH